MTAPPRDASKEPAGKDASQDDLARRVHEQLRGAGADERGIHGAPHVSPTMKEILQKYTQYATLTEVDEDGEHPLFPQSRQDRTARQAGGTGAALAIDDDGQSSGQDMINLLLRRLDNDLLPQLKEAFLRNENGLTCGEFTVVLHSHLGHAVGGDDRHVANELARLHTRLCRGSSSLEDESATTEAAGEAAAALGEGVEGDAEAGEQEEGFVTWGMFAKLLLDIGVVSEIVSSFNIVKVLSHIELDKIAPLKEEFFHFGNSLPIGLFIAVMKRQFSYIFELVTLFDLRRECRLLVSQLVELFEIIDINCAGRVSWEEFTTFLVDQGMSEDAPREFEIVRFGESAIADETLHQSHCEKAYYLKHFDKIAFVEQGSKAVKICTPDMVPYTDLKDFSQTPLCVSYIEKEGYVVVSCSDLTMSFYDANNGLRLVRRVVSKTAQLVMCWSNAARILFSADHEGFIYAWDIMQVKAGVGRTHYEMGQGDPCKEFLKTHDDWPQNYMHYMHHSQNPVVPGFGFGSDTARGRQGQKLCTPRSARLKNSSQNEGGKGIVLALLELEVLGLLASCGIDHLVMLWDIFTGKHKTTLKGHAMGVRCMAFAPSSKVLVTGGYDYNLMVWNPYVGTSIHTMKGHNAQIIGIECFGASMNQVVSADSEGSVKVWDLGTYQCLQTILVGGVLTLRAFVSVPSHQRIFCIDRKFIPYDYLNTGVCDQTDDSPILKAVYIPRLQVFINGCASHLRIWDAVTGGIKCVIRHQHAEITDFCVDDRGRKVFVADHTGEVVVYNATTGCRIKKLTSHQGEVSAVVYCPGDKNVISVSWDHSMMVHDEVQKAPWRTATNIHAGDITCLAFSRHLGLVATGASDCVIAIREYERLRSLSFLLGHKSEITALAFVEPLPLLVSADSGGNVVVWSVPAPSGHNHRFVNEVLTRFVNMQSLESSAAVNCFDPVFTELPPAAAPADGTFLTSTNETTANGQLLLYAGDEDGDMRVWDLSRLLAAADITPCAPKKEWDPRKKADIDSTHTTETMAQRAMSLEQPELPLRIDQAVVKQHLSWKAHADSIRSVKVYSKPDCIVTASYDQMVKIWTLAGELMTVLRAYGSIPWVFPVDATSAGVDEATLDDIMENVARAELELGRGRNTRRALRSPA